MAFNPKFVQLNPRLEFLKTKVFPLSSPAKKNQARETLNLLTDEDRSTNTKRDNFFYFVLAETFLLRNSLEKLPGF